MEHFPRDFVASSNTTDLQLRLINGSIFQLIGTDNIDAIMSTNPVGCVFAEYSLQDPRAWEYVRPILRENGGWAVFNQTPRGQNHGKIMHDMAQKLMDAGDPAWFNQKLTVDDTGAFSHADIDAERREGMDEELIQQEYFCSFTGVQVGSYFGKQMDAAEADGRICDVPYDSRAAVDTWWDIGRRDTTAIWFTQNEGRMVNVIDYIEDSFQSLPFYAKELKNLPYVYGKHHFPHDISVGEWGTGNSRIEIAKELLGADRCARVDRVADKQDSIEAARAFIPKCRFDKAKTERGRLALVSYHRTFDERRKVFSSAPEHDWASDPADAFQTLAVGHKFAVQKKTEASRPRVMTMDGGATGWMAA